MPELSTPQDRVFCRHHGWMVLKGRYDPITHSYKHSCRHVQCSFHGLSESRRRFHRRKEAFDDHRPFRSFIVHYGFKPDPDEVKEDMEVIQAAFHRFDPEAVVGIQLHPKNGDFHLHIGVQSAWLDMEQWLSGYWCPDTKRFIGKRGPKKKHCLGSVGDELLQKLLVPRQARLVQGEFEDQPESWLRYVMRCKQGWPQDEILPKFDKYKLFSGLITRNRRPGMLSRASIKAVVLAVAVLVAVVVPLAFDLGLRQPQVRGVCFFCSVRSASPVVSVKQKARGPPTRIALLWGDSQRTIFFKVTAPLAAPSHSACRVQRNRLGAGEIRALTEWIHNSGSYTHRVVRLVAASPVPAGWGAVFAVRGKWH